VTGPLVEFDGVTVRAAGVPRLERCSLTLVAGKVHALVGPNGAGKTTLLRALLGEVEFTGSIRRQGVAIGYVPQRLPVDRTVALTVEEFLALSRQRRPVCLGVARATRARIAALLERAGLSALAKRPIAELSGGEFRRVLLAHALDPRPGLLLLDEPTEGFDRDAHARFESAVREARAAGTGVLLVTHDRALVELLADEVTSLDGQAASAS